MFGMTENMYSTVHIELPTATSYVKVTPQTQEKCNGNIVFKSPISTYSYTTCCLSTCYPKLLSENIFMNLIDMSENYNFPCVKTRKYEI